MNGELYPGEFEAMEHNGRMDALKQEPCEDTISRQAVCNIVDAIRDCISVEGYWAILERLKKLPPVNPQPKTAHWEYKIVRGEKVPCCSRCGLDNGTYDKFNFCPECGAKMLEISTGSESEE